MKLNTNDKLWATIYYSIVNKFYSLYPDSRGTTREILKEFIESNYDIKIIDDPESHRWESIEILLTDEELTVFLLEHVC